MFAHKHRLVRDSVIASPCPSIVTCIAAQAEPKYSTPSIGLILLEQISQLPTLTILRQSLTTLPHPAIMTISLYLGIRKNGRSGGQLGKVLYRDGIMYFIALTGAHAAQVWVGFLTTNTCTALALINVAVQQGVKVRNPILVSPTIYIISATQNLSRYSLNA